MGLLPTNIVAGNTGHIASSNQVHAKLNDLPNIVRDYGADPTGTADSTTAVQDAFDEQADNGIIVVPPGGYKLTDAGSGFCLDITELEGLWVLGLGSPALNSGSNSSLGAYFFTTQNGKKLLNCAPGSSQQHGGPRIDNIGFVDQGDGTSTGFYVDSVLNGRVYNCRFQGFDGTGGYGMRKLNSLGDSSYWDIRDNQFHSNKNGLVTSGSDVVDGNYFESLVNGSILLDVLAGTGDCRVSYNKFEANGHGANTIKGVRIDGLCHQLIANAFEGPTTMIDVVAQGSLTNTRHLMVANEFTGSDGTETAISIGSNNRNCQVIGGAWSNLAAEVSDSGTDTLIVGMRPDTGSGAGMHRFIKMGGVYWAAGSGAAPSGSNLLPNGSVYCRNDGSGTNDNFYVYRGGAPVGIA